MPQNSKAGRQRPANNVPEYIVKDANKPEDKSDVVCEGGQLNAYLDELQQDKNLDFNLD